MRARCGLKRLVSIRIDRGDWCARRGQENRSVDRLINPERHQRVAAAPGDTVRASRQRLHPASSHAQSAGLRIPLQRPPQSADVSSQWGDCPFLRVDSPRLPTLSAFRRITPTADLATLQRAVTLRTRDHHEVGSAIAIVPGLPSAVRASDLSDVPGAHCSIASATPWLSAY